MVRSLILLALFFFLMISCSSKKDTPENYLVIGIESAPRILDPRYSTDAVSTNVTRLIFGGLLKRNKNLELTLNLAEKYEQPNPLTYIFRLKKNIYFHNGKQLTAKDVKYTFDSILDPVNASPKKGELSQIKKIEAPGQYTIVITLKEVSAPFLEQMTMGIVPAGSGKLSGNPVGAGPFQFQSYDKGEKLLLKANKNYFAGAPKLYGVEFKIVPDETVRLLELKKGNIHIVSNPITPAVLPWLSQQENISIMKKTGTNVSYIGFNMEDKVVGNKLVREAIAYAIDRNSILKYLMKNLGIKANSLISPINPFYNPSVSGYDFDPEKAKKLLDKAGYPNLGDGNPRLELTYKTSKNPVRKKIVEILAEQLRGVGIKVHIESFEWGTFFSDIKSGNFQMYSLTWVGIADPDIYHYIFHSQSLPPNGANRGRFVNRELDELLEKGRKETDFHKRKELYDRVQEIIAQELPYIHLWFSVNVAAINNKVHNFEIYPDESLDSLVNVSLKK
ncbi:MAG: ABC transporter substrate-binding protein [Nitrospinae bacterium]|nr:ABC transporter substrate-binding protein [Nitrospinota bacterium]